MSPFETYQSNAAEVPVMRKWFFRAFLLSLLIHAILFVWFGSTKLESFTPLTMRLVPRAFNVARLDIDPKLLESDEKEPEKPKKEVLALPDVTLPDEKPSLESMMNEVRATPAAPELTKPIVNEKPRVEATDIKTLTKFQETTSSALEKDLLSMRDQLIKDRPKPSKNLIAMNEKAAAQMPPNSSMTDSAAMTAASGRLDTLLGQAGGLKKGDQPLSLPGGALFEFNKAELQVPSTEQLRKLGQLIKKNPNVRFSIEGYTDSFGDEETNRRLSQARADAVRKWLIENMDIAPERIEAHGFGKTNLIVQPQPFDWNVQASIDAEIARQQPNRRVEIVFRFPNSD